MGSSNRLKAIDVREVRVGGEIGRRIEATARGNMLAVDLEREFLEPFRSAWDGGELKDYVGLGKFVDAFARIAAYTRHEDLIARNRKLVNDIIDTQQADGYIGIMPLELRFGRLWDVHEMSYMILGLTTDYMYWREKRTLETVVKLADYVLKRWREQPELLPSNVIMSDLGSEEAFLALHELTGERRYLDFLTETKAFGSWDRDIVTGRHGKFEGHVYDYFGRAEPQVRLLGLLGDDSVPPAASKALDFMLNRDGMAVTGGAGIDECWHDDQEGKGKLGETCASAYQIRFMHSLAQRTGDALYGDLMERMIYNALFAAQSPEGRLLRYYAPFEGERVYFGMDTYCCPNNFRRIVSELPGMVYYRGGGSGGDSLSVNLYTASSVSAESVGGISLHLIQETDYPRGSDVLVRVSPGDPVEFSLRFRIPAWCEDRAAVRVNGELWEESPRRGRFLEIRRVWTAGDVVRVELPMPFRLVRGRGLQEGKVAVMRGPIVFSLGEQRNVGALVGTADIERIVLDPSTLAGGADTAEPNRLHAQTCRVLAWASEKEREAGGEPRLALTLAEFADPDGVATYFRLPPDSDGATVDDELIGYPGFAAFPEKN